MRFFRHRTVGAALCLLGIDDMREALIQLLEPEVEALGFELVELEFVAHRGGGILRLYIDHPAGAEAGVGVEDCERVSRRVSALLDSADPIRGSYTLEVSSPGFDRPLRTPAHFARAVGRRVWVELAVPREGRRRYTGYLTRLEDRSIVLEVDRDDVTMGFDEIHKARLAPAD